jgi:hypothetical protein
MGPVLILKKKFKIDKLNRYVRMTQHAQGPTASESFSAEIPCPEMEEKTHGKTGSCSGLSSVRTAG